MRLSLAAFCYLASFEAMSALALKVQTLDDEVSAREPTQLT